MDGRPSETQGAGPLPTAWCERCGRETRPWALETIGGSSVCGECATKHRAARRARTVGLAVAATIVLGVVAGVVVWAKGRIPAEGTPEHTLYALRRAIDADDTAEYARLVDVESLSADAQAVLKRYDYPQATLKQLYNDVIGPGVYYASVCQPGDRPVLVAEVPKSRGDGPGAYTVYYTMDPAPEGSPSAWRVTHVNNVEEVAAAFHADALGRPPAAASAPVPASSG